MTPKHLLAGVGAAFAGAATLGGYARRFDWKTGEDESYLARANDAWPVTLYRYRPRGSAMPFPVLCGHDIGGSRLIHDLDADVSLARSLASQGFDTWLVDLRGRNKSWPAGRPDARYHWSFDDFVEQDVPAAIDRVLDITGAGQLFWIGFGISGQALYAAAIRGLANPVRGAVTLAAPVVTPKNARIPGVTAPPSARRGGRVLVRENGRRFGPILAASRARALEPSFRPENADPLLVARYLRSGLCDESEKLVDQVAGWIRDGSMRSLDGRTVYSEKLAEVVLPLLLVAGAADGQRPPAAVRAAHDGVGSEDKTFLEAGKAGGLSTDYGHDDLIASRAAARELYPRVSSWLRERS